MTRTIQSLAIAAVLFWAATLSAATYNSVERGAKDFRIDPDGTLMIENQVGDIEVIGSDSPIISVIAQKVLGATGERPLHEAGAQTNVVFNVTQKSLHVWTEIPAIRSTKWGATVSYTVRVPSTLHIKIDSGNSQRVRVANVSGLVEVKNVNGTIALDNVTGAVSAESANGNISYDAAGRLSSNVQLTSVNGTIYVTVDPDAAFLWRGQTIRGDFRTNLPVGGRFNGTTFIGSVNAGSGPTINTAALMGDVFVLKRGSNQVQTQSVRLKAAGIAAAEAIGPAAVARSYRSAAVDGDFTFSTPLGNVTVGQIRGAARVETRGGEVELGNVLGTCTVTSFGGPLTFGDISGVLNARTSAGDIAITHARSGGFAATDGGMIRVRYASGAMTLRSGGGDIVVSTASAPINAETRSGDIMITVDPSLRRDAIFAKTSQGSVTLNLAAEFAADLEATLLTADDDPAVFRSDFPGLSIRRDQVGSKTRIRVSGKLNGGGERVEVFAEDGTIRITGDSRQPLISPMPR